MGIGGWLVHTLSTILERSSSGRVRILALRFYVQPVASERLLAQNAHGPIRVASIEARAFTPEHFQRPPEAIRDRFADGSACIAAVKNDELVGFMWLQPGMLRERLVRCRMHALPENRTAWDYDFHIEPKYRLGRLFARLWDCAFESLRERGVEATLSWIRLENRSSENAHRRLGARRIGWTVFLTAFEHQFMIGSLQPKCAWSRPGRCVDLRVDATRFLATRSKAPRAA